MKRLGVVSAFLLLTALASGGKAPPYHPPTQAITFSAPLLGGGAISLADYLGREPVILSFWASWRRPCNDDADLLERAYQQYSGRLVLIGVSGQDPLENALAFASQHNLTFPVALDGNADVAWLYRVTNLPTTFFIDASGKIVAIHRGPLRAGQLERYLDLLLAPRAENKAP